MLKLRLGTPTIIFKATLLLSSLLGISACSRPALTSNSPKFDQTPGIVNGTFLLEDNPLSRHLAALDLGNDWICTGVIISQRHILTAAHCFHLPPATPAMPELGIPEQPGPSTQPTVVFGIDTKSKQAETRKIQKVYIHPDYCQDCIPYLSPKHISDLAIVELAENIPAKYQPLAVIAYPDKSQVQVAGYGKDGSFANQGVLRTTVLEITSLGHFEFTTNEVHTGTCSGDSGAPAFAIHRSQISLVGILSRGDGLCRNTGVFTLVDAYQDWIERTITPRTW